MDVRQPGCGAGLVDEPGRGVPVHGLAVFAGQQQPVAGRDVRGPVLVDECDELRMQGQVAVLAELPDGDVQPRPGTDVDHGVRGQVGELPDP